MFEFCIELLRSCLENPLLLLGIGTILYLAVLSYLTGEARKLKHIPSAYSNIAAISFIQTWWYFFQGKKLVDASFKKWPRSMFRIQEALGWTVVASDRKVITEVLRLQDISFSANQANEELVQLKHTLGSAILNNPYHLPLLSNRLRRSLAHLVPDVHDEITNAFQTYIPLTEDWTPIKCSSIVPKMVCQASNRIFVGYPLCRNPEFTEFSTRFTFDVFTVAFILRFIPDFLRPLVNQIISTVPNRRRKALKFLGPLLDARRKQNEESNGPGGAEKPDDMITWLMEIAKGEETTNEALTDRLLAINFGAIHTTSVTFTHALYYLAAFPMYAEILREEIDVVVKEHGWTKGGLDQMKRVDSFLKESQRLNPLQNVGLGRVALQDHTFCDGTFVPRGTTVRINIHSPHFDGSLYERPDEFDPLRFIKMQEKTTRNLDLTSTSEEYLGFGHGRHACPGRYLAASELKLMLAYLTAHYDAKFANEGSRPADLWIMTSCMPSYTAEVLFRKRKN
ncbi:hypothetical protein HYPSUDRAFT_40536 [Hypholoma sublateritium FD-334 SS-4]|uniref:Cytochrome P450 n=1 Tax=Hypholoma sublateritium (strain FD-334 SS-4) TaxID=945553 RepID=A0A0D2L6X1_HYPSF|nr:hypothetical protein HYPSUDRAFT_40536 [Hypholoma sublateritium FD-334 SS-4]